MEEREQATKLDADLIRALETNQVQIFVGSGMSSSFLTPAGFCQNLLRTPIYVDGKPTTLWRVLRHTPHSTQQHQRLADDDAIVADLHECIH